ncbi:hypothetical protein ACVIWV_004805 [Bradyrhizobium diazoefficiens]
MLEKHSESEVHVDKVEQGPASSIAFGLERIGLIAVRAPIVSCIVLLVLIVGAVFGIHRIKIDDSLSQLFRSDTREFHQYEEVTKKFPAEEFDVLVVVEGKNLLARNNLEKLRDFITDMQLVEGTRGLVSLFSARQAPAPGKLPAALFPPELPEGAAYDKFIETVKNNEIIRGKLLSEDGTLALIVLSLDPEVVASSKLTKTVADIRALMKEDLGDTGLNVQLSGVPVMQLEIRNAVERDGLTYNILGILAGCVIAIIFFRKISFMIAAAFPPMIAILLALGALGWANFNLNMFLNVMTPLIMVISFSDSMQLTFAARDRLIAGQDKFTAFKNAVLVVGPACVLTHGTAGISFIALQFSSSDLIRKFGEAGLAATIIALVAVLSLVPVFGVLFVRNEKVFAVKFQGADAGVQALRNFCYWIAVRMVGRPGLFSLIAVLFVGGLGVIYANLEPRYRLADQVPDKRQAVAASDRLDAKLTGANPVNVLVQFPKGESLYSPETLQTIADVHATVEKAAGVGNVWSVETLRPLARGKGRQRRRCDAEGIYRCHSRASGAAVHRRRAGCGRGRRPRAGQGFQPTPADRGQARFRARRRPQEASRLRGRGDGPCRHRGAQFRQHDREAEPRTHRRIRAGRDLHRPRLPLLGGDVRLHPAGHLPCRDVGDGAVGDGRGAAIRQRRRAHRLVRPGIERHHPLPQSLEAGEQAGRRLGARGGAGDRAGRTGLDPDHGGAGLRPRRHRVLRPAVAAAVRLAQRLLDGHGPRRRPLHPAADGDVADQPARQASGRGQARDLSAGRRTLPCAQASMRMMPYGLNLKSSSA